MVLSFAMFFVFVMTLTIGGHIYFYRRLVRDPRWSDRALKIGKAGVIVLWASMIIAAPVSFWLPRELAATVGAPGFVWMGLSLYVMGVLLVADLLWLAHTAARRAVPSVPAINPDRRQFIVRNTARVAGLTGVGVAGPALSRGLGEVDVHEVSVALARLPPALSGLTLVQLTDMHIGGPLRPGFVESIVEKTNALKADAVVITGDLVDGSVAQLMPWVEPLRQLQSRFGTFFVTGNHEYYSGADDWAAALTRLGIRVLRNQRVSLGDAGASFDLAGIEDFRASRFGRKSDVERALKGRDPERELVLLAHQPRSISDAEGHGVGLMLSGHTHGGGQLWPITSMYPLFMGYSAGLYRHDPQTQIYVSRGTGYWGPPLRLGAPAEITKIVLTPT